MKRLAWLASIVILAGFYPLAEAGQDRIVYTSSDGPGEGGLVRAVRSTGGPGARTHWAVVIGSGLYKSVDSGANWTPSGNGIDHKFVRQFRPNPNNAAVLYV